MNNTRKTSPKALLFLITSILFLLPVHAASPSKPDYMRLDLRGVQILDIDGINTFEHDVRRIAVPSRQLIQDLEESSGTRIVSRIYELARPVPGYQNIYLYVGRTPARTYKFVRVLVTPRGFFFTIDPEIVEVTRDSLTYYRGPASHRRKFTVTNGTKSLFR